MAGHCYAVSFMLSVTLKPFMLIAVMLSVVMLSVMAPLNISRVLDVVLGFQESIKNNILKRTENFQESLNPATGVDLTKLFWC